MWPREEHIRHSHLRLCLNITPRFHIVIGLKQREIQGFSLRGDYTSNSPLIACHAHLLDSHEFDFCSSKIPLIYQIVYVTKDG